MTNYHFDFHALCLVLKIKRTKCPLDFLPVLSAVVPAPTSLAAFRSTWYARPNQGSFMSLPEVMALHRRGAYPIQAGHSIGKSIDELPIS